MITRVRTGAAVTLTLLACLVAAAGPSAGAEDGRIGVRLLEAPVARKDDPRAQSYIVDHVSPGTTIERSFEVSNTTSRAQGLDIYAGPAAITDGAFIPADAGERGELTQWTTLSQRSVDLDPGATHELTATIRVPDDASPGERYGVIWASVASAGDGQVQVVNRVGIRVYLSVGPGGEPASDFEVVSLSPGRTDGGRPFVRATVRNTGGRAIDLQGTLRLVDGPGGLGAGPFEVETGTLAPGDREALPVLLDKSLPAGPWEARLVLRSGLLEKRATATFTFPDQGVGVAVDAEEDVGGWGSWPSLVGLALLALLLPLLFRLWRRRDVRRGPAPHAEVAPAS